MSSTMRSGTASSDHDPTDASLRRLIADAMAESGEIISIVIGDHQGLPIMGLVRGSIPMMTVTAIAAMSARSAEEAAAEVDLDHPSRILVETSRGDLVMIPIVEERAYLIAMVSPRTDREGPLHVLDALAADVGAVLSRI